MRPRIRLVFSSENRPRVHFHTSNHHKFLQARSVFDMCGLHLTHFRSFKDPYDEVYEGGRSALLHEAVSQVKHVISPRSIFFVEDTSIRISALSGTDEEVPGLRAKEWFASTNFDSLDAELKRTDDRQASVRSDIALHLPGVHPVLFSSETSGTVSEGPPEFPANSSHPWLTPHTFNGWFVPHGAGCPLGAMSFEESLEYDFRVKALLMLLDRLAEYTAVLNLSPPAYDRFKRVGREPDGQRDLFQTWKEQSIVAVIGPTCAGKTEFGRQASTTDNIRHIEASSVLRDLSSPGDTSKDSFELAKDLLAELGPDVVTRRIVEQVLPGSREDTVVITGLRTIEEIAYLRRRVNAVRVIFLRADRRTRYQRQIQRARPGFTGTIEEFRERDKQQEYFGLLSVGKDLADEVMENDGTSDDTLENFRERTIAVVQGIDNVPGTVKDVHPRYKLSKERLYRCLAALRGAGSPLTAGEIEVATRRKGWVIEQRNVNQALRKYPEFAQRKTWEGANYRYQLTSAGVAYLSQREQMAARMGDRSVLEMDEGGEETMRDGGD